MQQEKKVKAFATISDVAKHAKVGKTSVSRYLNDELDKLSPALKEKIANAIEYLSYQPNQSARMLKAGQSKLIGLLLADITNPYSVELMQSIERKCRELGYMLMVCNTDNCKDQQDRYLTLLKAHRVDGIIINPLGMTADSFEALKPIDCPFVILDRANDQLNVDCIGVDNKQAAKLACQHLADHNFESILIVTQPLNASPRKIRVDTIQAFVKSSITMQVTVLEVEDIEENKLTSSISNFIHSNNNSKKAIFCINGVCALYSAKALTLLDINLDSNLGFITIDDPGWAQIALGGITSIRQPLKEIGEMACERLLLRMSNADTSPENIEIAATLITRNSTQY
ncbi:MAG: LacI family DNA-binding transcriptional regulator [Vibrio sp.]|uniref:LacI family DNA-binding transcriptional regulator n=1 Tax=Vibrio sp. TaxID=678 RepID=UPI003A864CF7